MRRRMRSRKRIKKRKEVTPVHGSDEVVSYDTEIDEGAD
jgi:hypothetical protein